MNCDTCGAYRGGGNYGTRTTCGPCMEIKALNERRGALPANLAAMNAGDKIGRHPPETLGEKYKMPIYLTIPHGLTAALDDGCYGIVAKDYKNRKDNTAPVTAGQRAVVADIGRRMSEVLAKSSDARRMKHEGGPGLRAHGGRYTEPGRQIVYCDNGNDE